MQMTDWYVFVFYSSVDNECFFKHLYSKDMLLKYPHS